MNPLPRDDCPSNVGIVEVTAQTSFAAASGAGPAPPPKPGARAEPDAPPVVTPAPGTALERLTTRTAAMGTDELLDHTTEALADVGVVAKARGAKYTKKSIPIFEIAPVTPGCM